MPPSLLIDVVKRLKMNIVSFFVKRLILIGQLFFTFFNETLIQVGNIQKLLVTYEEIILLNVWWVMRFQNSYIYIILLLFWFCL